MQKQRHNSAALPCPHEAAEQRNIFEWAGLMRRAHPELQLLYHVPNEGKRTWRTGARLKSEGLKPGVPDICLPVARGKYHGLYVELKLVAGGAGRAGLSCAGMLRRGGCARRDTAIPCAGGWQGDASMTWEGLHEQAGRGS